jgi:hypothetical protein
MIVGTPSLGLGAKYSTNLLDEQSPLGIDAERFWSSTDAAKNQNNMYTSNDS